MQCWTCRGEDDVVEHLEQCRACLREQVVRLTTDIGEDEVHAMVERNESLMRLMTPRGMQDVYAADVWPEEHNDDA